MKHPTRLENLAAYKTREFSILQDQRIQHHTRLENLASCKYAYMFKFRTKKKKIPNVDNWTRFGPEIKKIKKFSSKDIYMFKKK